MRLLRRSAGVLVALTALGTQPGCTLVGLGIGAVIDGSHKKTTLSTSDIDTLKPGTRIIVFLKDSRRLDVRFVGRSPEGDGLLLEHAARASTATPASRVTVALSEVDAIQRPRSHSGKVIGAAIGAAIDTAIIVSCSRGDCSS